MAVDVSSLVVLVQGAGVAVGAVGTAVTGVKVLTSSFRYCREVLGYSPAESMRLARQHGEGVRDLDGKYAAGRQMEKDQESRAVSDALDMSVKGMGLLGAPSTPLADAIARIKASAPAVGRGVDYIMSNDGALPDRQKNIFKDRLREAVTVTEARELVNEYIDKYGDKMDRYAAQWGGESRPKLENIHGN